MFHCLGMGKQVEGGKALGATVAGIGKGMQEGGGPRISDIWVLKKQGWHLGRGTGVPKAIYFQICCMA